MFIHQLNSRFIYALFVLGFLANGNLLAQDDLVVVSLATPSSAIQGTFDLNVEITGENFAKGAKVRFLRPDSVEDWGDIIVNKVRVKGSGKLTANIDVTFDSVDVDFDIEVELLGGRKGKGTTLFKVESLDTAAPNNDGNSIPMTCAINESGDILTTVGNDEIVNPYPNVGSPYYTEGLEKVLCHSGGVVSGRLAGLRLRTDGGGNLKNSVRFLDLDFDPPPCDATDPECRVLDPLLKARLPAQLTNGSPDHVQLGVRPYADVTYHDHIHLMTPGVVYTMRMNFEPKGLGERYLIRMMARDELPSGALENKTCPFTEGSETDDVNVYIWQDGVFSEGFDGLPDGYTVSTGLITPLSEDKGKPPEVSAGWLEGLVCSNISLTGEPCATKKGKDGLCHNLGKVPVRFTMHMEYQ